MKWDKFTITTTTEAEDIISSMLADLGVEGVEIQDNTPLTEQDTAKMFIDILPDLPEDRGVGYVSFYLKADTDHKELLEKIMFELDQMREWLDIGTGTIEESQTEDIDWMNNWKEFFHAFYIDDIFIKPTWEEVPEDGTAAVVIEIDPGISFGTGKHETTRLCIRQLRKYMKKGDKVLDLGCGSGILSIVSRKLGAGSVMGTDIDEACIQSTHENYKVNHLEEKDLFITGNLIEDTQLQKQLHTKDYDIVVANILADVIIPMAEQIPDCLRSGGYFIASGIIDFKEEAVAEALTRVGLRIVEIQHDGEWVGITAIKE